MSQLFPADLSPLPEAEAPRDCPLCPRLVALREDLRQTYPDWWNAPVPAFGDRDAWLALVGLAPGMFGANRTGRPFTGDHAGVLLYETLLKFGLAAGVYEERPDDTLRLAGCIILNSVKCLPPQNRPLPAEVATCRRYYSAALDLLPNARVLVALGQIAHVNAVRNAGGKQSQYKFAHLAEHALPDGRILIDSYHCSRYNQNTGRLTRDMFEAVFARAVELKPGVETVALWRPVGPEELELIRRSGMTAFPPRLPEQPIFYPVLSEDYAVRIARDWNVKASGAGYVTSFRVRRDLLDRYEAHDAGGRAHREYWIPAEDLEAFNHAIVGKIEVTAEFR